MIVTETLIFYTSLQMRKNPYGYSALRVRRLVTINNRLGATRKRLTMVTLTVTQSTV